ncbi:Uncharacterised protein [Mycobacteroides abscessus subsp. abscessus]|nr:Uncharacterised protein [Mycobacteroides abscessus subsp. abscessus]
MVRVGEQASVDVTRRMLDVDRTPASLHHHSSTFHRFFRACP